MTEETLKRKAYSLAMKLKSEGLEDEVILARLEKQGIPDELSIKVLTNMGLQAQTVREGEERESINILLVISGVVLVLCLLSIFVVPGVVLVPSGLGLIGLLVGILGLLKRSGKL